MFKIKTDAGAFREWLGQVNLEGLVFDCIVKASSKGLLMSKGLDVAKSIFFYMLHKVEVEEAGDLIIGNIGLFCKILNRFSGRVTITGDDKVIKIRQQNKIGKFAIAKKKDIDSYAGVEAIKVNKQSVKTPTMKMNFKTNAFIIEAKELDEIVKDADVVDEHIYSLEAKGGEFVIRVEKDGNSFSTKMELIKKKFQRDMVASFGHGIKEVFRTLKGPVKVFLDPKAGAMLIRFGKKFRNVYLITTRAK